MNPTVALPGSMTWMGIRLSSGSRPQSPKDLPLHLLNRFSAPKFLIGSWWNACILLKKLAGTTRLELATSAVTGQRSNQLNYVPNLFSSGSGKPLNFLFFSSVHRVARLNRFHPIVPNSGVLSTGNRKEVHPDAS